MILRPPRSTLLTHSFPTRLSSVLLGATIDDAVVAQLVRAATNICEAFIGQWLVVRDGVEVAPLPAERSEEHTSELQSLMRISYAVFCLKKKKQLTKKNYLKPTPHIYKQSYARIL